MNKKNELELELAGSQACESLTILDIFKITHLFAQKDLCLTAKRC